MPKGPKGPKDSVWNPSEEQRATAIAMGKINKARQESAEHSMQQHVDHMIAQNIRRRRLEAKKASQDGRSRRRHTRRRRTRR